MSRTKTIVLKNIFRLIIEKDLRLLLKSKSFYILLRKKLKIMITLSIVYIISIMYACCEARKWADT